MSAYAAALLAVRRAVAAIDAATSTEERAAARAVLEDALALIEASADRRRLTTKALAARIAVLETQLVDRDPGERARAICTRLGIGRSRYYELRPVRKLPDSQVMQSGSTSTSKANV